MNQRSRIEHLQGAYGSRVLDLRRARIPAASDDVAIHAFVEQQAAGGCIQSQSSSADLPTLADVRAEYLAVGHADEGVL